MSYRDRQVEGIFVENIEARLILEYTQAYPAADVGLDSCSSVTT